VNDLCQIANPLISVMRMLDGNQPVTGKIYKAMYKAVQSIRGLSLPRAKVDAIVRLAEARWSMMHTCLHAAGYVLDPEFRGDQQHGIDEVMKGFHTFLERVLPNVDDQVDAVKQLDRYRNGEGLFGYQVALASATKMPAHAWWAQYGSATPLLQEVAMKCLSQVSSASSCERNWSLYSFIHSKKRNKLDPGRAEALVFVHSNLRLLNKIKDNGRDAHFYKWEEPDTVPERPLEVEEIE
jgi:hAT family C-terminal dimerisation region